MEKYFIIFKQTFSERLIYRGAIVIGLLEGFLTPALMLVAIASARSTSGITVSGLLVYYVTIAVVYSVVRSTVDEKIDDLTASGDVNNFLLKPLSFFRYMFAKEASERLVTLLVVLPLVTVIALMTGQQLKLSVAIVTGMSVVLSFILSFNLSYLIGLISFWVDEFWAIHNIRHVAIQLLGGVVLPYTFFPEAINKILYYTPFPYLITLPQKVISGTSAPDHFVIAGIWIIVIYIAGMALEKTAIAKYSHTGS